MNPKPVRLGKIIELKYVPFSELAVPWNTCIEAANPRRYSHTAGESKLQGGLATKISKPPRVIKLGDLDALRFSLGQFGLLKPFEVAELPERLDFFYGGGKYVIIDGQRRYFALREMLKLPTEHDEMKERDKLVMNSEHDQIKDGEVQAQKQFDRLNICNYVLIPCLVYPYKTFLQMMRHTIEDKRLGVKPSSDNFNLAERMRAEGIEDLHPDDLSDLWETRAQIEDERQAIEKTLHEMKKRIEEKEESRNTGQAAIVKMH